MENNEKFLDKTNYGNEVYLRCVIKGFLGFLTNRFKWTNHFENGPVEVVVPVYNSLMGDQRWVMDAFYDDVPDKRVNHNTDIVPRTVITLKSWLVKTEEFTNPNIWLNHDIEIDDELRTVVAQVKAVPLKLTFEVETLVNNEIEVYKAWQTFMEAMWMYKYFIYNYKRIPINAVFNFAADVENPIARVAKIGESNGQLKLPYTIDVHTFFPIFDVNSIDANKTVQYILNIWQKPTPRNNFNNII
jgi:hypothetical protein